MPDNANTGTYLGSAVLLRSQNYLFRLRRRFSYSFGSDYSYCEYTGNFFKLRNHLHFGNFINLAEDFNAPVVNKN
jgi:hypothetical protein